VTQSDIEKRPEWKDFLAALEPASGDLAGFLEGAHIADVAEWLQEVEPDDAWRVYSTLEFDEQVELFEFASEGIQTQLLERISIEDLVRIVEQLPSDEVVDLLALADAQKAEAVLRQVDFERAAGLRELSAYPADSAGGIMTTDFVAVPEDSRIGDVIKEIKAEEGPASEEEIGVFVVDQNGCPVGFASDRDLLTSGIHTEIRDSMDTDLITVRTDADQEEAALAIHRYGLQSLPVVDRSGVLVGVIAADDAIGVIEDEAEEDIRRLVGTSVKEQTRLSILARVRGRIPMQALTVVGGLATAWILDRALPASDSASPSADLLRYLPIIIGLAGNVGIQSSTILVRAFATGEVTPDREKSVLASEIVVGLTIGILCGLTTSVVAAGMEGSESVWNWSFGVAVGSAITVAVTWASLLGCAIPMVCRRLGIDPAVVAGPFMITMSDISGASIFVLVAHMILGAGAWLPG